MKPRLVLWSAMLCLCSAWATVPAQPRPLWHDLKPGPYATGFRIWWKYDYSRTWRPEENYKGSRLPDETARPSRISIWYPAQRTAASVPMPYSGYLHVGVPDQSFSEFNQRVEAYDFKSVRNIFKEQSAFDRLLKTPTAAFLNTRPAKGRFPLVVFSLGQNDHTLENIVLWEYLASHGYVVATVPQIGTSPRRFQLLVHDPLLYEAQVRDLEFVIQQMHSLAYVDASRLALMGHSFGGIYSLITAMRNSNVDAVVGLDPTFISSTPSFYFKYWEAPYYDAGNMRAPLLVLYKGIESENQRWDIVDGLGFSDRYLVKFPHLTHGDFNSYPMLYALSPTDDSPFREYQLKHRSVADGVAGHEIICRYVLSFLNAYLKDDASALQFINVKASEKLFSPGVVVRDFKPGLKAPTEEEFYSIIEKQGLDAAIRVYREAKALYPQNVVIRENVLRRIGNEAGYYGNSERAIDVFRFYVAVYPQSIAAYLGLAEAYEQSGNKELTIKNYEKALELEPNNARVSEQLKRLREGRE